jgi:hypothetical protein
LRGSCLRLGGFEKKLKKLNMASLSVIESFFLMWLWVVIQ